MYPTCTSLESRSATNPSLPEPEPDLDEPDQHGEHPGERDRGPGIAAGDEQRRDRGQDQRRDRRVGAEHQHARGPEQRVADQAGDRRVQARHRRQPGQLGVGHALRDQDRRQHDAGDEVRPQPRPVVRAGDPHARHPALETSMLLRDARHRSGPVQLNATALAAPPSTSLRRRIRRGRVAPAQQELADLRGDDDRSGRAPMQISHWLPVSSTVSRIRWRNRSSVAKMIAATDISEAITNVRSLNVSRLNTERSSSRAVNEKSEVGDRERRQPHRARQLLAVGRARRPRPRPASPLAMTRPATTNQRVSARVRIGCSGLRGRRSISPSLGSP